LVQTKHDHVKKSHSCGKTEIDIESLVAYLHALAQGSQNLYTLVLESEVHGVGGEDESGFDEDWSALS
jgi:hypothetical protein